MIDINPKVKKLTVLDYFNGDELAANVWKDKYADDGEETPNDMHRRMAKEFVRADEKYHNAEESYFSLGKVQLSDYGQFRGQQTEDSIYELFKDFKYIIPQGSIMATLGTPIIASLSNCWVTESPYDSYGGILHTDSDLAYYYKRRGGVGVDISTLRPKGSPTKNTAKSTTGAVSFMHRFSNTTEEVAMEGRRGALMLSISINHPDVMEFIKVKRNRTAVTGANISIRLTDEFMKAVENDEDFVLRYPVDIDDSVSEKFSLKNVEYNKSVNINKGVIKKVRAKEYWDEIIKSAHGFAEPGLMYWDSVIDNDPAAVYSQFTPSSSNPCGEQFLNPYDSCRLMALNLFSFVDNPFTNKATIDMKKLYNVCYEHTRMGDNLVDLELEYIQRIIDKIKSDPEPDNIKRDELELWQKSYDNTKAGRRIGLGITALADMLAALGHKYDSESGIEIIDLVMSVKMRAELDCSIDLSILRGSFEGYNSLNEYTQITNADGEAQILGKNKFYEMLLEEFPKQVDRMIQYGRRSVSWSTIAPTGTVSLMTQTSSGCEPLFQPYYMRRKKINPNDKNARLDFVDELGVSWQEFPVLHQKFKDWIHTVGLKYYSDSEIGMLANELSDETLLKMYENSPWYKSIANDIDWEKRNEIQALLQKYTTNAISSTINLPSSVTESEVSDIYMNGWKFGLKGQTVYVDGSRSGVLVSNDDNETSNSEFKTMDAFKRPKSIPGESHVITVKGDKYTVIIGMVNDNPYELFAYKGEGIKGDGIVEKRKRGDYVFISNEEECSISINLTDEQEALTRGYSWGLRNGGDIKFAVEQLQKTKEGDFTSFNRALARVLKKYIADGSTSTLSCGECGGNNVIFEEGCNKCRDCGSSKCG